MELFTVDFWSALLVIVFIDLMLAGDNAIVIGMAARNLPKSQQKKAVIYGTAGAVIIRIVATLIVVKLLGVPWLHLIGGLLLVWIAYKLLTEEENHDDIKAGNTLGQSIRTIILADAAMGIDNVLAVAGASHGDDLLVIIGLLISIPVVVWGSTIFIRLIEKFSWIAYIGAAVLGYTSAKMIAHEKAFGDFFTSNDLLYWSFVAVIIVLILLAGVWKNNQNRSKMLQQKSRESH
ncbi:TerC family protein [Paenibacillus protaetiae]|uniref:TerC family protein n=1 Tax=Paenibacillus protaetiae TaxID=2509456 RepID=A0A4P6EUS6_9BACL|nr:TerC family protein [Paenibacillus protaetiae]QAY65399.1 TerC family protein [Paenibacillus protaetiae]